MQFLGRSAIRVDLLSWLVVSASNNLKRSRVSRTSYFHTVSWTWVDLVQPLTYVAYHARAAGFGLWTPLLTPIAAYVATEVGNGTMYVSAVANGSFTLTHANSATTARTFLYALHG